MPLIVWGINHETAPLLMREQFAIRNSDVSSVLQQLTNNQAIQEMVLLATCNRSEWYCICDHTTDLLLLLANFYQVSSVELQQHGYCYTESAAIEHLLCVSCGLNSMILGEPQIFGQVKAAFQAASQVGSVGPYMHFLFRHVFAATKRIRYDSGIGENPVSMASAALNLAKYIFSEVHQLHVVLVGLGEMTRSALNYFHNSGAASITLVNRTLSKAEAVAKPLGVNVAGLEQLTQLLTNANIVISATASNEPIITQAMLKHAMQTPRQRPLLLLDLAMPRDIEASACQFDFVYLYNIDDLKQITEDGLAKRKESAKHAKKLITSEVAHCIKLFSERRFTGMIRAYREQVAVLRTQEIDKAMRALAAGQDPSEVLQVMARALTNKLMHQPSVQLRQAGYDGHIEVLEIAKRLLGIGDGYSLSNELSLPDPIE